MSQSQIETSQPLLPLEKRWGMQGRTLRSALPLFAALSASSVGLGDSD